MSTRAFRLGLLCAGLSIGAALLAVPVYGHPANETIPLAVLRPSSIPGRLTVRSFSVGKVLHTADGGQVFGFDVNQNGTDGLLASAQTVTAQGQVLASVETFSQTTMKITKTVVTTRTMDDFVVEGIGATDVGLVLHDHPVNRHNTRLYLSLNPVSANRFSGSWVPPNGSAFQFQQVAANQAIRRAAIFGFDPNDNPIVFSSDVAANTIGPIFHLDPNQFSGADQPQLAQDVVHNLAVLATSPDAGAVGGAVPLIATVNLTTGKIKQFNGARIGIYHSGYVNGLAVDSTTQIACTTTELDAAVEFYDLTTGAARVAPLPGAQGNQFFSGSAVASDPIHRLFLVAQGNGSVGPSGGSVVDVFDEQGNLIESIVGFKAFGVNPGMVVNPAKRTGFIMGPTADALLQFIY